MYAQAIIITPVQTKDEYDDDIIIFFASINTAPVNRCFPSLMIFGSKEEEKMLLTFKRTL